MAALVGVVLAGGPFACSSSEPLQAAGGHCMSVTDCQDGLVCCDDSSKGSGAFTCMASAACIQPGGTNADAGNMGMGTGDDATTEGDGAGSPDAARSPDAQAIADSSGPETGTSTPDSGGGPMDSGEPQEAAPPDDSGGGQDAPTE